MEVCFGAAEKYVESQSVRALAAMATPAWTKAVIGTAAAMVIETARPMCAKQLILEVMLVTLSCSVLQHHSLLLRPPLVDHHCVLALLQVPTTVRKQIQQQLDSTTSAVIKAAKASGKASNSRQTPL